MTSWVTADKTPEWLDLQGDSKLIDFNSNGEAVLKNQDFHCEDIQGLLVAGKQVVSLQLNWEDNLQFTLNEDGTLKRLKFADYVLDKNDDILKEDIAQRFDADFILMTSVLSELTKMLLNEFGGEKEHDQ